MSESLFPTPSFSPGKWLAMAFVLAVGITLYFLMAPDTTPILPASSLGGIR